MTNSGNNQRVFFYDIINDMPTIQTQTWRFLIILVSILLASCATTPTPEQPQNQVTPWNSRVQTLSGIEDWDLKGLIAIRASHNGRGDDWTADWVWQQDQNNYTISLFGPLGSHSVKLTGAPGHVLLETSNGKKFTATSPESLLNQQMGWQLPVSYLRYWVRGLPVPNVPAQKQFDNYNHLVVLTQQGWVIRYLRYTSINQIDVPNKIFLANPDLNVKIIINQWQLSH